MNVRTKKCASCPQWFFWAKTERGAFLPLNEDPSLGGEYVVTFNTQPPTAMRFATLSPADAIAFPHRYDHHARTCTGDAAVRRRAGRAT